MIAIYQLETFQIVRDAVARFLRDEDAITYAGGSEFIGDFWRELSFTPINVLLLDMDLRTGSDQPIADCLSFCRSLRQELPGTAILLHSPYRHAGWLHKFIAAGVNGFLSKNTGYEHLLFAIKEVDQGNLYVCPIIQKQFQNFNDFVSDRAVVLKMVYPGFTAREEEVLEMLSQGLSTKEIADRLYLSEKTIETHRASLLTKAGVRNTVELIAFVSRRGLLG